MKVGFLGPPGTFSEEAAARYFRDVQAELVPFPTILDLLDEVRSGTVDKGIVPIENTIEGSINVTVDTLAECPELFVQGEMVLPVTQHLLGLPGATVEGIREVWSIAPAIAQCRQFLRRLTVDIRHFTSTAAAAAELQQSGRRDVAAIASAWAAQRFGLEILADDVQDVAVNHTRFVVVAANREVPPRPTKTMLLIIPCEEHTGVLANILHVFAALDLNLTWIVSRPTKERLGMYQFYLDVEAGVEDPRVEKALSILGILGHQIRVLGSYESRAAD